MNDCPKSRRYGKHYWFGERLIGTWFWMSCKWCGEARLHDFSGKDLRGTHR